MKRSLRRQAGHALILLIFVVLIVVSSAIGMAGYAGAVGDYQRRQETADAASRSGADVLADRLRHIGRVQKMGSEALAAGDIAQAQLASKAAWRIAEKTPEAVRKEIQKVAQGNGAKQSKLQGVPRTHREWFVDVPTNVSGVRWVGLSPKFKTGRITVKVEQTGIDRKGRWAESASWVGGSGTSWKGPLMGDGWEGRRAGGPYDECAECRNHAKH